MTIDQDRGAYAPHMDAPLAFDARRPTDRRPLPMTLIASAGVLVLIVGALAMAYRGGVRGSAEPKLVGQPVGAIKTAAAPEAASDAGAADSKMDVYSPQNVPTQAAPAPNFAPAPEQPKPRPVVIAQAPPPAAPPAPAPTVSPGLQVRTVDPVKVRIGEPETTAAPVVTAADRQAAATSRTAITPGAADRFAARAATSPGPTTSGRDSVSTRTTASVETAPAAARPAKSLKGALAQADGKAKLPAAETPAKPLKTARAVPDEAPARAAKAAGGPAAVQVGAFSSAELAQKGFADAGKLSSLGGHARSVEKISRDGHTFYRATLGGFADKAAAKAFCAQLAAKGGRCLVKG